MYFFVYTPRNVTCIANMMLEGESISGFTTMAIFGHVVKFRACFLEMFTWSFYLKVTIRTIGIQTRLWLTLQVVARLEHLVELADRVETKRRFSKRGLGGRKRRGKFQGRPKNEQWKKGPGSNGFSNGYLGFLLGMKSYPIYKWGLFHKPNVRIPSFNIQGSMERIRPWLIPKAPRFRSRVLREFSTTPGQDEWWGAVAYNGRWLCMLYIGDEDLAIYHGDLECAIISIPLNLSV